MALEFIDESVEIRIFPGERVLRKDVAKLLGIHPASCTKLERRGELTRLPVGGKIFYALKEVKRLAGIE
ncbi:hypothetical protein MnTg02_03005 [bacterium MnTg02]|nr:hypothetical protein MnTg02_03005 [bacterium MnTg02]